MSENTPTVPVHTTEVAPYDINEFKSVITAAPTILDENEQSLVNATNAANALLESYEKQGQMNDVLDEQMADTIDRIGKTMKSMNEKRKPFTQLVGQFTKMFTSKENEIKAVADKLQVVRNKYATFKAEEANRKQREAEMKLAVENERIEARRVITTQYKQAFEDYLLTVSMWLSEQFEATTLENYEKTLEKLQTTKFELKEEKFNGFITRENIKFDYNFKCEENKESDFVTPLLTELSEKNFAEFSTRFANDMTVKSKTLIDKMPSKKQELEAIAKASAEEKDRLEKEAKDRKERADADAKAKSEESKKKAETDANMTATQEKTEAIVDVSAEVMADDTSNTVKESYKINVRNKVGYMLIFQKWFEDEAKGLTDEKIEKMTIARMIAHCEKDAIKNGVIINSEHLEYVPTYKAK